MDIFTVFPLWQKTFHMGEWWEVCGYHGSHTIIIQRLKEDGRSFERVEARIDGLKQGESDEAE